MQPGVELLMKVDKGAEYCIHCSLFNNSASTSAVTLSVPVCVCVCVCSHLHRCSQSSVSYKDRCLFMYLHVLCLFRLSNKSIFTIFLPQYNLILKHIY